MDGLSAFASSDAGCLERAACSRRSCSARARAASASARLAAFRCLFRSFLASDEDIPSFSP
ncbi:unnamed protein product [Schistosoma mattheei]|uniref:Uncharacterized protein n=1 Tax=Schistosoma mattheei TaxID=31246 RepID=A0A183Q517_9TREM|nr:unnamed protein product [Schistosoma mattheei]